MGFDKMYMDYETEVTFEGNIRIYWIDSFPVNRAEFLYHIGEITPAMTELLKAGRVIEVNGSKFWIEGWDRI